MSRTEYPIEKLKRFLKEEGINKLIHLMKRNYIERIRFENRFYNISNIDGNLFLNKKGMFEKENIILLQNENYIANANVFDNNHQLGINTRDEFIERPSNEDISINYFIDSLKNSNQILNFSRELKKRIQDFINLENELLFEIENIKSLKTTSLGRELIVERRN